MTNFEKIKNMGIEEMAYKLDDMTACVYCPIQKFCDKNRKTYYIDCKTVWKKWLESEVENNG